MSKMSKASTLLTIIGAAGVVVTAVLAAKASPKAEKAIIKAEIDSETELTTFEKIKVAAPVYIPTIISGVMTTSCILGSNFLNKRVQLSLMTAYTLLHKSYAEYKNKVTELYGEDADARIRQEMIKDHQDEFDEDVEDDKMLLFWDETTMEHFRSPVTKYVGDDGLECYIISTPLNFTECLWAKGFC